MPFEQHWQWWESMLPPEPPAPEQEPPPVPMPTPDPAEQHKAVLLYKRLGQLNALINQRRYRRRR